MTTVKCWRCSARTWTDERTDRPDPPPGWSKWLVTLPAKDTRVVYACPQHRLQLITPAQATEMP